MAGRGSGIGLSMSGTVGLQPPRQLGGPGTNNILPITSRGRAYGKMANMRSAAAGVQSHQVMFILVLAELAALLAMRHGFRHYHGG